MREVLGNELQGRLSETPSLSLGRALGNGLYWELGASVVCTPLSVSSLDCLLSFDLMCL